MSLSVMGLSRPFDGWPGWEKYFEDWKRKRAAILEIVGKELERLRQDRYAMPATWQQERQGERLVRELNENGCLPFQVELKRIAECNSIEPVGFNSSDYYGEELGRIR